MDISAAGAPNASLHSVGASYPPARRAWYLVIMLCLLFAVSHVDRYMLPLLAVPVAEELLLSDTQLGLLLGMGFAVLFAIAGLPLAYLLDRHDRIRILAICVIFWSLSTLASAFADSFVWLLICRSGVALGEAALYPAAISLVVDLFEQPKRAKPLTVISAVSALMTGGSFFVGAAAVSLATFLVANGYAMAPWRLSLIIVAIPGIVFALILLATVSDPRRKARGEAVPKAPVPPILPFLRRNWRFYAPFFLGLGLTAAITLGTVAWVPVILGRAYGMETATAGYLFGIVCLVPAALGTLIWSRFSRHVDGRGGRAGPVLGLLASAIVMGAGGSLVAFAPDSSILLAVVTLILLGGGSLVVLPAFTVHAVAAGPMHARLTAMNLLATSTVGLMGGPLAIPLLAKNWPGDPHAIAYGLAIFSAVVGSVAVLAFALARRHFVIMRTLAETSPD